MIIIKLMLILNKQILLNKFLLADSVVIGFILISILHMVDGYFSFTKNKKVDGVVYSLIKTKATVHHRSLNK
ncbi:hypothetical protein AN1V17_42180 [Vallitalea sediminicola]